MTGFIQNIKLHGGAIRNTFLGAMMWLVSGLILFTCPSFAGDIIVPPRVHWIGPEANCDYPSIQEALDDVFSCGVFACPPGVNELRLSANYNHQGLVLVNKTFNIRGGYSSCEGSFNGINKLISPVTPNSHLFVVTPPDNTAITNEFSHLSMVGSANGTSKGGVILMGTGESTLRLKDSNVISGTAEQGGGIAMLGGGSVLEITDSEIAFNQAVPGVIADGDGGGIYCENGGIINFISGDIHDNEADRRGGGIVLDNCQLNGSTDSAHRFIQNNTVLRSTAADATGQGGGIFATGSDTQIQLGALLSQTFISNNEVILGNEYSDSKGGGLHLELGASAHLLNVQIVANKATDGGGLSLESGSFFSMDRTTGPCDPSQLQQCSAFIDNEASGGVIYFIDTLRSGIGSAIFTKTNESNLQNRLIVRRTVFRGNDAYSHNGDGGVGSMISVGSTETSLEGNLMFLNSIEDDLSVIGLDNYGGYIGIYSGSANLIQNTIAFNENSGAVLRIGGALVNAVGNLIFDPAQEYGIMDNDISDQSIYSACNITSDELIDTISDGGQNNVVSDPGFVDSSGANFRLLSDSPAVNRCNDALAMGLITQQYDLLGRSRLTNGPNGGFGPYDAGAYEYHLNLGEEVDLVTYLQLESDTGSVGATFNVQLRNIGMNTAVSNQTHVLFEKPENIYNTSGNWMCNEVEIDGDMMVRCTHLGTIPVLSLSATLTIEIEPDAQNNCSLHVLAEPGIGTRIDTDLSNNEATIESFNCFFEDLIFADGFE